MTRSSLVDNDNNNNKMTMDHKTNPVDDFTSMDNIQCGIGSCRPTFAQRLMGMACFTGTYSLTAMVTSALNIYINSQITTLEKHFNFSSSVSGFLMSCNDLGYLTTTLLMSYFTRRVHVPRALAFSTIVYGLSGLFCTLAFFGSKHQIPSPPKDSDQMNVASAVLFTQTCQQNTTQTINASCQNIAKGASSTFQISDTWRTLSIGILATGMILQGVAKSPRQPFLGTYVDDNVPKTKTSLYLGIMIGMSIFGPAIAFALGGVFSNVYVTLEETNMTPRDPRWLGAWWLGFIVFGIMGLVVAVPLIFFPRRMRIQPELIAIENAKRKENGGNVRFWREFIAFLKSMFRLCFNPVYICLTLASGVNLLSVSGMMAFMPKYLESQFTITAAKANILLGGINVFSACIGTIVGGCMTSRLKLSPLSCLKFMICSMVVATAFLAMGFFIGCDQPVITGIQYRGSGNQAESPCVQNCNCNHDNYFPVCGSDNRNYFSPCHAGCKSIDQSVFTNCSCLNTNETLTARGGLCVPECGKLYAYLTVMLMSAFATTLTIMPGFIVSVRSVKEVDKPLAIGFGAFAGTLIGWFPGPVVFGVLIDTTCLVWKVTCSRIGACSLYDIELLRLRLHSLMVGLRLTTIAFYVAAVAFAVCSKRTVFQPHTDATLVVNVNHHDNGTEIDEAEVVFILRGDSEIRETDFR